MPAFKFRFLDMTLLCWAQYWAPLVAKSGNTADAATQAGGFAGAQGLATSAAVAPGNQRSPTFRAPLPAQTKPQGQVHPCFTLPQSPRPLHADVVTPQVLI